MKKLLLISILLFSSILLLSSCGLPLKIYNKVAADNTEDETGLRFYLQSDGTYSAAVSEDNTYKKIEIPSTYNGKTVTRVFAYGSFDGFFNDGNDVVEEIYIPEGVTEIGDYAFNGFKNLKKINIPNGVTSIGKKAFAYCKNLESINLPDSVTYIGKYAFCESYILGEVNLGEGIEVIGESAFYNCYSLSNITTGSNIAFIGEDAFFHSGLSRIDIKDMSAWCNVYIGDHEDVELLPYVNLFFEGEIIKDLVIPEGVKHISNSAFNYCNSIESVSIPGTVKQDVVPAFKNCYNLKEINVAENNTVYESIDGVLYAKDDKILLLYPNCKQGASFTVPDGVKSISQTAFTERVAFTSITLSDSVAFVESQTFEKIDYLTEITLGKGITSDAIDFLFCCKNLMYVWVSKSNEAYTSINGVLYSKDEQTLVFYPKVITVTSFTVPSHVTSIGEKAFWGCENLTSIELPEILSSINDYAFAYCSSLVSVRIPSSVTSIGRFAFYNCQSLESVKMTNDTISIGSNAFSECPKLTNFDILPKDEQ